MNDPEKKLKAEALAAPSAHLDRRMDQLFAAAPAPRFALLRRPIAAWQCAAACALFAFGGFWAADHRAEEPVRESSTVYIIQADPQLVRSALDSATQGFTMDPERIEVQVVNGVEGDLL
jgi:hypothetical protein